MRRHAIRERSKGKQREAERAERLRRELAQGDPSTTSGLDGAHDRVKEAWEMVQEGSERKRRGYSEV